MKEVCQRIKNYYQARGYLLMHVYFPEKEIRDGLVVIRIVEGRLGKIEIRGNKRIPSDYIEKHLRLDQSGHPARYSHLVKALI